MAPSQGNRFSVPDPAELPAVPGALNVTDLDGSEIVAIALKTPVSAQTTIQDIADFVSAGAPLEIAIAQGVTDFMKTTPIVSTQAYTIAEILQIGANNSIRLHQKPSIVPTTLTVRIDAGYNGNTYGQHSATGTWSVRRSVDDWTYELIDSAFIANSVFKAGHCYVPGTLVDASAQLNLLSAFIRNNGPGAIYLPPGALYVQSARVIFPENCSVAGFGSGRTNFLLCDAADQPPSAPFVNVLACGSGEGSARRGNISVAEWKGFSVYGNREKQIYLRGMHAIALGDAGDTRFPLTINFDDIYVWGSAGYGTTLGDGNAKVNCNFRNSSWVFSDSDTTDVKNRLNGNYTCAWTDCRFGWHGMGDYGTDLSGVRALPNNSIITLAGTTRCSVPRSVNISAPAGSRITIAGATTFDGVNPNGSWNIVLLTSTTIIFDTGQTPTSGGVSGGGAQATMFSPAISAGDAVLDCRGVDFTGVNCTWEGELWARSGFRQRHGEESLGPGNGAGGTNLTFINLRGIDLTPAWTIGVLAPGSSNFVALDGDDASVEAVKFSTTGGAGGIFVGPNAVRAHVTDASLKNCSYGLILRGDNTKCTDIDVIDPINKGVEVHGFDRRKATLLPPNPFSAQSIGSNVVIVYAPAFGLAPGASVSFTNPQPGPGIIVERSNLAQYPIQSVIDVDHYTINGTGSATATTAFGGDQIVMFDTPLPHTAINTRLTNVSVYNSNLSNTAIAFDIGRMTGEANGQARGTVLVGCENNPEQPCLIPYLDHGSGTRFEVGNTGLPNNLLGTSIVFPGQQTASWGDPVATFVVPTGFGQSVIDFGNLGMWNSLLINCFDLLHNNVNANWAVQVSNDGGATWLSTNGDYARIGNLQGLNSVLFTGGIATPNTAAGLIRVTSFNDPLTQCDITTSGGQVNSATAVIGGGGFVTVPAAHNALRVICSATITGGRIFVYGKQ